MPNEQDRTPGRRPRVRSLRFVATVVLAALLTPIAAFIGWSRIEAARLDRALDSQCDARTALDAYTALRRFNLAMFRALTAEQRTRAFTHPEYGTLTVDWIVHQVAGHDIHHLKQIEQVPS